MVEILKFLGKFILLLFIGLGVLLAIDGNYFDFPVAREEAGLTGTAAPTPPFATAIAFQANSGYSIQFVMAAKDNPLNVKAELISPSGILGMDQSFKLNSPSGPHGPVEWKSMLGAAEGNGTYTLRITQDSPGRITTYIFQGPFFLRIIGFPVAIAIFLLILETASRRKIVYQV